MMRTPADWHERFLQQAGWTEPLRRYLIDQARLPADPRIFEAGCGTGAVLSSLYSYTQSNPWGLDIHLPYLRLAKQALPQSRCCAGDALRMPFASNSFDLTCCHFLLLWISTPEDVLAEMVRVTRRGGWVTAFAEPDYGGRVDYPPALEPIGQLQIDALKGQGAQPRMGRRLAGLFTSSGLQNVETGVLGGQWKGIPPPGDIETEWQTLANDVTGLIDSTQLEHLRQVNEEAWGSGERVLFIPTFYAAGRK